MLAVGYRDGTCELKDRAAPTEPTPGEGAVRPVRIAVTPDLAIGSGGQRVPGHAFVGVVESVGSREHADHVARRVLGPRQTVCQTCDLCRSGLSDHCRARELVGVDRDGCLAERVNLPVRALVPIPEALDENTALFAYEVARALHVAQRVRVDAKVYVTVLGDTPGALIAAQLMARLNASVRCLGERPSCYGLCEKWGVKHRHTDEVGRRADQDVVIDCTGDPEGLSLAFELVRPRGAVVLVPGPYESPAPHADAPVRVTDLSPVVERELEVIGVVAGDLREALAELESGTLDVVSLITRREPLSRAAEAIAVSRQPDQLRVVIEN